MNRLVALLPALPACLIACRSASPTVTDASVSVAPPASVSAALEAPAEAPPPIWLSSFDATAHCASVRAIAGAINVVPAWSDAGAPTIPSGFAACKQEGTSRPSVNWSTSYSCKSPVAPSEQLAADRFRELKSVWRTCFAKSGLPETHNDDHQLVFRKPAPAWQNTVCQLTQTTTTLELTCYRAENN